MKKRLLALCLTVVLAMGVFPLSAAASIAENEPNGSMEKATVVELDGMVTGTISTGTNSNGLRAPMDTDWFRYDIPSDGTLTIVLLPGQKSGVLAWCSWEFTLVDGNGKSMASYTVDCAGGAEKRLGSFSVEKGAYYMKVEGSQSFNIHSNIDRYQYYFQSGFSCAHKGHQTDTLTKEATCSERGEIKWRCDDCGKVSQTEYIEKLAHTPGEWEVTKEATCAVSGRRVKVCTVCGETAQAEDIAKLEHTPSEKWEVTKEATCKAEGKRVLRCTVCKSVIKEETIAKLEHTPGKDWEETKATCKAAGKRVLRCTVCGEVAKEETIAKLEHTPGTEWEVTEATCKEAGTRVLKCTVCGDVAKKETIARLDHSFGEWKTTKTPTCKNTGAQQRTCKVCGYEETKSLQSGHVWGDWNITAKPTCTGQGQKTRTCQVCKVTETENVASLGHSYGSTVWTVMTRPTCTLAGKEKRTCQTCGATDTRTLPATGHTFGDWTQENDRNVHRCGVCNYVEAEKLSGERSEVSVTKANASTPTVIVLVVPAFSDVSSTSWYQSAVTYAYNLGLMVGNSETTFNPLGNMTVGEAVTMAARARNSYNGGTNNDFKSPAANQAWYQPYVDYAIKQKIMQQGDFDSYERVATRSEMAYLFANALPAEGMKAINAVTTLPDVDQNTKYSQEIFKLYNAGIVTGSDDKGTFSPDKPITRSEAAAIITRVTLSSERRTLALK